MTVKKIDTTYQEESNILRGLYAITDAHLTPFDTMLQQVTAAIEGGIKILQFRYKEEIRTDALTILRQIQALCKKHGVLFIINDHKQLAYEIDADGIHIGKDDEHDIPALRSKFSGKIIGVSCYGDINRAIKAQEEGADYVAFGSFFHSPTKPHSNIVPTSIIKEAKERLDIPVCVIGGITTHNAQELTDLGADMLSVISGLWESDDITKKATEFNHYLNKENR